MRIFGKQQWTTQLILAMALSCTAMPGVAQAGKLQLKNLDKLADRAAEVNDVSLDGSLLQLAVGVLKASDDPDSKQLVELIKELKGIYVKNFEFDSPGQYSQADVEAIRSQLTGPGWQRVVASYSKQNNEREEVYLLKDGKNSNAVTVLVAEARQHTVDNLVGAIDPEKLSELAGHFGIPGEVGDHSKPKLAPRKDGTKPPSATPEQKNENDDENPMD